MNDKLSEEGISLSTRGSHETNPFNFNHLPKPTFDYIRFFQFGDTGKTEIWSCLNIKSGKELGKVKWYGPWRQYCFSPSQPSVYSAGCMEDIAGFIRILMDERK